EGTTRLDVAECTSSPVGSPCTISALPHTTSTTARRSGNAVSGSNVAFSRSTRRRPQDGNPTGGDSVGAGGAAVSGPGHGEIRGASPRGAPIGVGCRSGTPTTSTGAGKFDHKPLPKRTRLAERVPVHGAVLI